MRPLRQLSAIGVRLALDDFGTGYSSLTYLRRLPVQVLKIDRSFVVDADAAGAAAGVLLAGIAQLGTALGMQIVAEGVETARQAARVRDAGCHLGQGFLWARPMCADDVTALLRRGADLTPAALPRGARMPARAAEGTPERTRGSRTDAGNAAVGGCSPEALRCTQIWVSCAD